MAEVSGPIPVARILAYWKAQFSATPAVIHDGRSISWEELDASSNRLARAYAELGVGQDDFVTIALPNGIEFFQSCFATWKLGATPQPISAKLPKFELDQIVEIGRPKLIVGVPPDEHSNLLSVPVGFAADPELSDEPLPERTAASLKAMTSGGSTGRPKLIVAAAPAVWDPGPEIFGYRPGGCMLVPGPLYHNGPFSFAMISLFKGGHVVVTSRFDAEETLALIEAHRVNTVYTVPTMMQRIWNLGAETRARYDLSSLEVLLHLAAPCPAWLKEAFINWLGAEVIWEVYAGTEGQGSTTIRGDEWLLHRGSVGKPGAHCEMKIVGEDGATLPPGVIGEVYLRPKSGPGTTYRYIGAKAKAIEGGWESLGDLGYMDADGYLYLSDRLTDMILCGGANVYPAEIEAALDAFPGVRSSAVIGLPHADLGNAVHAIVDVPNGAPDEKALLAHLTERLARYKLPRSFEFVTEPLRDDAGKVRRKTLREVRLSSSRSA